MTPKTEIVVVAVFPCGCQLVKDQPIDPSAEDWMTRLIPCSPEHA